MLEFLTIIGASFLGGLALNLAPCILPVLSLKIISFVNMSAGRLKTRIFYGGAYSIGIIASFMVLCGITIAVKIGGGAVLFGGFLLSSAWFNALLGCIIGSLGLYCLFKHSQVASNLYRSIQSLLRTLVAYSRKLKELCDLRSRFTKESANNPLKETETPQKIPLKVTRWLKAQSYIGTVVQNCREKMPFISTFLNGCLTTFMGSACCGPVLAYAMGIALMANYLTIVGAFLAAGIGMALPYFLLALIPTSTKFVPKTGRWTLWVEKIAGIMMLLSAIWFIYLAV